MASTIGVRFPGMFSCPVCATPNPGAGGVCSSCGNPLGISLSATLAEDRSPALPRTLPAVTPYLAKASANPAGTIRFDAGSMLAGRFRIVHLAGRGGMGEVYRAEDLKLEQVVALKFLPEAIALEPRAIAQLHREIRIARQLSHPNICRVFDVGEEGGAAFLTMEFVDGEDLATLLRRIGRLPPEKGLEIARQVCAGLAAAHARDVLHHDLKPGNVMLDASGRVRITDFGLASFTNEFAGVVGGTPAYMAPERLAGGRGSAASDVYSVGVLLYEVFTGRRPFEGTSVAQLQRAHAEGLLKPPSQWIRDIDAGVERTILRCLERDPSGRPQTAAQVLAELHRGDHLAASVEVAETSTAELARLAQPREGLTPRVAWTMLWMTAIAVAAVIFLNAKTQLLGYVPDAKSPESLAADARHFLKTFGHEAVPADAALSFEVPAGLGEYVRRSGSQAFWQRNGAAGFTFVYRESPEELLPLAFPSDHITSYDPPQIVPGMASVELDLHGRLRGLTIVPPATHPPLPAHGEVDWAPLFKAAGFELSHWKSSAPTFTPRGFADANVAWEPVGPRLPDQPTRIEASAYRGKPLSFTVIEPWTRDRWLSYRQNPGRSLFILLATFSTAVLAVTLWIAWRNVRARLADTRGAYRLGMGIFLLLLASWALEAHHFWGIRELELWRSGCSCALYFALLSAIFYLAVESPLRRRWPQALVGFKRLLAGDVTDPQLGRELLAGCLGGAILSGLGAALDLSAMQGLTFRGETLPFEISASVAIASRIDQVPARLGWAFMVLVCLLVPRALLRKTWLAVIPFVIFRVLLYGLALGTFAPLMVVISVALVLIEVVVALRFGLVALAVAYQLQFYYLNVPLTLDIDPWYRAIGICSLLAFCVLALYGFKTSLGGKRVFNVSF